MDEVILVTQLTKVSLANLCYKAKNFNTLKCNDFSSLKSNQMPNKPWRKKYPTKHPIFCSVKGSELHISFIDILDKQCYGASHPKEQRSTNEKQAKDAMIVDMEQLQDLPIRTLSEKLKNVKQLSAEACLFKVHERLRKPNPEAYTPLTISIGPYHHTKPELRKMERLKELYTQSFLDRRTGAGVEECWKKLKDLQGRAERYYGDLDDIKFVDDDEFVKMLLLDGCFIVEFVIRSCLRVLESKIGVWEQNEDDPIYKMTSGMKSNIVRDMLLLENQLPFFVLKTLYDMTTKMIIVFDEKPKLSDMVKTTFLEMLPKINIFSLLDSTEVNTHENGIKHLLQVAAAGALILNLTVLVTGRIGGNCSHVFLTSFGNNHNKVDTIYALYGLQVSFKKLELTSKRNLLQKSHSLRTRFVGWVRTSSNDDFYYKDMYKELNRHYNKSWNVAMAKLRRNYFHSPWAVISTFAAILLLSLAILQTLIAALDLYK
nr:UPF0481 protein At3g47200-like [Ipomoea batatas]